MSVRACYEAQCFAPKAQASEGAPKKAGRFSSSCFSLCCGGRIEPAALGAGCSARSVLPRRGACPRRCTKKGPESDIRFRTLFSAPSGACPATGQNAARRTARAERGRFNPAAATQRKAGRRKSSCFLWCTFRGLRLWRKALRFVASAN